MRPVVASIVFTAMAHAVFAAMRMAVALDAIHMGASPAIVGAITALFALLPALGSVHMGRFIDRNGARALTIACPLLLASAVLSAALLPGLFTLAVASLVVGGSYLTLHIVNQQVIGRLSKTEDRPVNFALAATWIAASSAVAPVAAGYAIDHTGFRWTYVLIGMVPLLALIFYASGKLPIVEGRAPGAKAPTGGSVFHLLRDTRLRRIYIISVMFATSWDVFLFMTPIYGASLKLPAAQIGTIITCFSIATFVVRLFTRPIARRFTPWQILLVSLAVNGAASLAFGLSGSVPLLLLFAFTMGLGHGMANPMMNTLLYEAAPSSRMAEVLGFRTSMGMTLQVAMPIMAGALGALIGIAPLFWMVSAMQFGGTYATRANWHLKRSETRLKAD